jgi:heme-degrading monooxygenase HmoA
MFVQLIRCKLRLGGWEKVEELMRRWQTEQASKAPGFKGEYVLREKSSSNACTMVVLFENEQLARQNSDRPETNQFYQEMLTVVDGQPEFIDTEVVHSYLM